MIVGSFFMTLIGGFLAIWLLHKGYRREKDIEKYINELTGENNE
jgi:hypothetical protein